MILGVFLTGAPEVDRWPCHSLHSWICSTRSAPGGNQDVLGEAMILGLEELMSSRRPMRGGGRYGRSDGRMSCVRPSWTPQTVIRCGGRGGARDRAS